VTTPSPFVLDHLGLAPPGVALDVACGTGRHALALARAGRTVEAIDRDPSACALLAERARAEQLPIRVACADLERLVPAPARYALVVNALYLDRRLVPALCRALRPGGLLLFETFSVEQLASGHPRNPAFVLGPRELLGLVGGLQVIEYREGPAVRDGRTLHLVSLAARAPAT
jgi:SAM-dependent methyltransferase